MDVVDARPARSLIVLALVGAGLAVVGGLFLVFAPGAGADGSADVAAGSSTAAEKQIVTDVTDFAVAYNTYDVADVQGYQQRVGPLLTSTYRADFVEITDALFVAIAAKEQKSTGADVKSVAIQTVDGDSATVLVVVDAKVTNTDNEGEVLRQFRWTVDMVRESGGWLVSGFESVAAEPTSGDDVTPTDPTATPTTPAPSPSGSAG